MYLQEQVEVGLNLNVKIYLVLMYFEEWIEVGLILNIKIDIYNAKIFP